MRQEQFILPTGITVRDPEGNRYLIESLLGKGEFGAVYLVRERDNEYRLFALKEVINPNKIDRERFAFECEVLKRLNHGSLPRVHHVFENDKLKRVYLLMDYIDGLNLEDLRREQTGKRFTLAFVLKLLAPIVDALSYLHEQDPSIVHRDVKPANIIVSFGGGKAMLADFGSAKEYAPGTGTILLSHRSPGYAAPEQYRGGTSPSTDIYGLGATLYALLTGSVPIDAPSRVSEIAITGVDPLKPVNLLNPAIPRSAAGAIQRALSIRGADRFETVAAFWQGVVSPGPLQIPAAIPKRPQQSLARQGIEDADTRHLSRVQIAPGSRKWGSLATLSSLLIILMAAVGFLCYLLGYTVLSFCCLGVLLLTLGGLLFGLSSRTHSPRDPNS